MAANLPMILTKSAQSAVLEYARQCWNLSNSQWNIRDQLQQIDLLYQREIDFTKEQARAKVANRYGDPTKFQNITVPVVMPAVEAAVTYQASVFLTGVPIFGAVADPANMDAAMQMETVIDDQATRGGWTRELILFLRDGFKYNLAALEAPWERCITAALETDLSFSKTEAKQKELIWEGNKIRRMDMYNTIFDSRVSPAEIHTKGEFAGYTEMMSRIALKQYIAALPTVTNAKEAFESGVGAAGVSGSGGIESYYTPQINPNAIINVDKHAGTNWMHWAGLAGGRTEINYSDSYEVTTLYARILPSDFKLSVPSPNTPQIWKFVIVNHAVIIYAERQTNAHNYLPMLFSQPLEDGLDYQTKSLAQNIAPIQSITTALANSQIAARRRAISDRVLFDPSRIDAKQINNENASAKIPVRPAAYGKNVSEAVYQFPYRDDQTGVITQEIQQYVAMGNNITGQNAVRQGQFVKGNKTRKEFSDVMANANGRDQLCSMLLEAQVFTPLKTILKTNILQYQGGTSLYNRAVGQQVNIDPIALRKSVTNFKISDGLTPADKLIDSDVMTVAMQQIGSSPALSGEYNLGPMFSYLMKTQGAHISAFEKSPQQKSYEQAMQQWQQTIMGIYKQNPEVKQEQLPVQPKPQDYGYNPQQQVSPDTVGSAPAASVAPTANQSTPSGEQ